MSPKDAQEELKEVQSDLEKREDEVKFSTHKFSIPKKSTKISFFSLKEERQHQRRYLKILSVV